MFRSGRYFVKFGDVTNVLVVRPELFEVNFSILEVDFITL